MGSFAPQHIQGWAWRAHHTVLRPGLCLRLRVPGPAGRRVRRVTAVTSQIRVRVRPRARPLIPGGASANVTCCPGRAPALSLLPVPVAALAVAGPVAPLQLNPFKLHLKLPAYNGNLRRRPSHHASQD